MPIQIQLRHDTAANWTFYNPTLAQGEIGIETDTNYVKIGDGSRAWSSLPYFVGLGSGGVVTVSKAANYNLLPADAGTYFDNGGASGTVIFQLPTLAAGLNFHFTVVTNHLLEIVAPTGVSISLGTGNSAPGGNISSSLVFSSVRVYAPAGVSNQWIGLNPTGAWDVN